MNDSNESMDKKEVENFINVSQKAKTILENLAWKFAKLLKIPCNYVRVDVTDISMFFINKTVLGDKEIAHVCNIPYDVLSNPDKWLQEQVNTAKECEKPDEKLMDHRVNDV